MQLEIIGKQSAVQKSLETTWSRRYFQTAPSNFLPRVKWFQDSPAQNYLQNVDAKKGKLLGLRSQQPATRRKFLVSAVRGRLAGRVRRGPESGPSLSPVHPVHSGGRGMHFGHLLEGWGRVWDKPVRAS